MPSPIHNVITHSPVSFHSLHHRVLKRIAQVKEIADACAEAIEVHPEEIGETLPAIYLPNQLARIRQTQEETDHEHETRRIQGGSVRHAATVAYRFDRGLMIDGVVYAGGGRQQQVYERESLLPRLILPTIMEAALPSSVTGSRYFGHFISDDACAALLAAEFGPVYFAGGKRGDASSSEHSLRYLEIYKVPYKTVRSARLGKVWLFQDYGMNDHKRKRLQEMRSSVRAMPGSRSGHGVYFRRRGAGQVRHPVNEAALEDQLARLGFEIIDVTVDGVDKIIERTKNASVVVGVEGSAMVHGIMSMAENALLLCLQPPYRFNNVLKAHTDALGIRYGFTVGEAQGSQYNIDVDDVMRTIDLARV